MPRLKPVIITGSLWSPRRLRPWNRCSRPIIFKKCSITKVTSSSPTRGKRSNLKERKGNSDATKVAILPPSLSKSRQTTTRKKLLWASRKIMKNSHPYCSTPMLSIPTAETLQIKVSMVHHRKLDPSCRRASKCTPWTPWTSTVTKTWAWNRRSMTFTLIRKWSAKMVKNKSRPKLKVRLSTMKIWKLLKPRRLRTPNTRPSSPG